MGDKVIGEKEIKTEKKKNTIQENEEKKVENKEEAITVTEKEIKTENKENAIQENEEQIVYIGKSIATDELQLHEYQVLLGKPLNYDDLKNKYENFENLFIPLSQFVEIRREIMKGSIYYQNLRNEIYEKMTGGN